MQFPTCANHFPVEWDQKRQNQLSTDTWTHIQRPSILTKIGYPRNSRGTFDIILCPVVLKLSETKPQSPLYLWNMYSRAIRRFTWSLKVPLQFIIVIYHHNLSPPKVPLQFIIVLSVLCTKDRLDTREKGKFHRKFLIQKCLYLYVLRGHPQTTSN